MSSGKKQQKKRKRQSSPPFKSQIARRLEILRNRKKDLWADDDDDESGNSPEQRKQRKISIALTDSDEEKPSSASHRSSRSTKLRKKTSHNHNKNATCLICSILSQLSSYNCCANHLSILKNPQPKPPTVQWLPEQVMILPITNEIVQHYLDPQQIHHLRIQGSTDEKPSERSISTQKSTKISKVSDTQKSSKLVNRPSQTDIQPLASTITVESTRSSSLPVAQPDVAITTIETLSSITVINTIENLTTIDDNQQQSVLPKPTDDNKQKNPWEPISDEVDAVLEHTLSQIESLLSDTPLEYTPTTARRTDTSVMASRLPKLPLKEGRFRNGKPILNRTSTNGANEYRPLAATTSNSPVSSTITVDVRSPPPLPAPPPPTINIENESASPQTSNRRESITDDLVASCIFTQDVTNHSDNNPTTTITTDVHTSVSVPNETNQSNGVQHVTSSTTTTERTPSRISCRMNPDGTCVRISRPPLPTNHQSPSINSLRRTSTDVTPAQPNTKQV